VALEFEYVVVTEAGAAPDQATVAGLFGHLSNAGFITYTDAITGEPVAAERTIPGGREVVEVELGYPTVEISGAPCDDLFTARRDMSAVLAEVVGYFASQRCLVLGLGIQPLTPPSRALVSSKNKYLMYERFSANRVLPPDVGADIHLFTVTAASQCHIDVDRDEAARAVDMLNAVAGVQLALTANSAVWRGNVDPHLGAVRETFYDLAFPPSAHSTTGSGGPFASLEEYVQQLLDCPVEIVSRDGAAIEVTERPRVGAFLDAGHTFHGRRLDNAETTIRPEPGDLFTLARALEFNARLAPAYGTVESRISCQQPPGDEIVVAAFVLGLLEKLEAATRLSTDMRLADRAAARSAGARTGLRASELRDLAGDLLRLSQEGLRSRGLGEASLLEPLFQRLSNCQAPADESIEIYKTDGLPGLLRRYAYPSS
jgi:gamma-glutamylcysteine synthetase